MFEEIEWFESDGVQGGERGLVVNLEEKTISKWNGEEECISLNNINDVKFCINKNIEDLKNRHFRLSTRLSQKEVVKKFINGGHSISEPLSEEQKKYTETKIDTIQKKIIFLEELDINKLIKI